MSDTLRVVAEPSGAARWGNRREWGGVGGRLTSDASAAQGDECAHDRPRQQATQRGRLSRAGAGFREGVSIRRAGKRVEREAGYRAQVAQQEKSWASSDRARHVMRGNRSRETRPELAVRSAVHSLGLRYRVSVSPLKHVRRSADMVFVSARVAVFVDGCFWHGCPEHYVPSISNREYWADKIFRNRARDSDTDCRLL